MTGRTHDLAAFTGLTLAFVFLPLFTTTPATLIASLAANFIGGLAPDLDQPTSGLWKKFRGGSVFGFILSPLLGGHRTISHSLVGLALTGWLLGRILEALSSVILVDMTIVWWAFMVGMISHLVTDSFTREGIPLLFPLPVHLGIPPIKALRIKTGGLIEKSLIFPSLLLLNFYLYSRHYHKLLDFLRLHLTP